MTSHTWRLFLAFGLAAAVVYFLLPNDVRVGAASSAVLHHIGAVVSLGVGDAAFLSTSLPDLADAFWLATALLGLEVNRRRGDDLRPALAPDAGPARPPGQAGVATTNTSGFPLVELALADADDLDAVGRHLFDRGIYVTPAWSPPGGRLPHPADRGQHRRAGRPPAGRARGAGRPLRLPPPPPLRPSLRYPQRSLR